MASPKVIEAEARGLSEDIEWLTDYCQRPVDPDQMHLPRLRRLLSALSVGRGNVDLHAESVGAATFMAAAGDKASNTDDQHLRAGIQAALREQRWAIGDAMSKGPWPEPLVTTAYELAKAAGSKALPTREALGVTLKQPVTLDQLGTYIGESHSSTKVVLEGVKLESVAVVKTTADGNGSALEWSTEGGLAALPKGAELMVSAHPITGDDGAVVVYRLRSREGNPA